MSRRRLLQVLGLLIAAWSAPATAYADHAVIGQIFAVGDHVIPGETLVVRGGQLEPGDELALQMTTASGKVDLGRVVVADDGTIELSVLMPAATPLGYATITATNGSGSEWTSDVLVGERAEGPQAIDSDGPFIDAQLIALLMVAVGLVIFVAAAWWYLRGRAATSDKGA